MMDRKEYIETWSTKLASYIYANTVLESSEGNWATSITELKAMAPKFIEYDTELQEAIIEKLYEYDGVADACIIYEDNNVYFDLVLYTDYLITVNDYDMEENEDE